MELFAIPSPLSQGLYQHVASWLATKSTGSTALEIFGFAAKWHGRIDQRRGCSHRRGGEALGVRSSTQRAGEPPPPRASAPVRLDADLLERIDQVLDGVVETSPAPTTSP